MAENHWWLIFNPSSLPQLTGGPSSFSSALAAGVCSGWILSSLPSSPAGSIAMSLQSLPLPHSRAEITSPLSQQFVLPQEGAAAAQHLPCSPGGAAQTQFLFMAPDRDPLADFSSPGRILLLFHQTNNLLRLLLLLIFCSLARFHAPFCSQRCLS